MLSVGVDIPTIEKHGYAPHHVLLELDNESLDKNLQKVGLDTLRIICEIGNNTRRVGTTSKYYCRIEREFGCCYSRGILCLG